MKNIQYPYPVETLKHWYVTIVGGQSADLGPAQIGVNREALVENTNIVPYEDNILVSKLENNRAQPLFTKRYFTVVPLDEASPDASSKSPKGEVVFPKQNRNQKKWLMQSLEVGEPVILNNVMSQRYGGGLAGTMDRLIRERSGMPFIENGDN